MADRVLYNSPERIMQPWGNGSHKGIDLGRISSYTWAQNYEVYANCTGVVAEIQTGIPNDIHSTGARTWGNYVYIKHPNGMYSRYAHLKDVLVKKGQKVDENTKIGIMGDSGKAFGAHLHFEVATGYSSNLRINPTPYLTKAIYQGSKPTPIPKPTPTPEPQKFKYNVGDKMIFNGVLYATVSGTGAGQSRKNFVCTITKRANGICPYNINNGLGWVKESALKPYKVKSIDELAREVIQGKWGNGMERYTKLTNAGYNYDEVQRRVNEILK